MSSRRLARENVLKALFQWDLVEADPDRALREQCDRKPLSDKDSEFAFSLLRGVLEKQQQIDEYIEDYAHDWTLDRLANIDRNLLRLGIYELLHREDIPAEVSVSEAVKMAKIYGAGDSYRFINGILGRLLRDLKEKDT